MGCDISGEQLWSWIDREAPELDAHVASCPECRKRADILREDINRLTSDLTSVPIPEEIGPYKIKRLLGEGGQALVYEAEQPSPQRPVALKVLKGGHLVDEKRVRQFKRETQTLARLSHPSIATIYEAGRTQEGLYYFAMELVDGEPLHSYVKKNKPARKDLLRLLVDVCKAVEYAHQNGVIHRDLKPSNILIAKDGSPKVLDFGLARLTQADIVPTVMATKDGRIEGTPRYMSPEHAAGKINKIDARSDVYALGVTLYELLTGVPPTDVSHVSPDALRSICEDVPRRPSSVEPALSGELDAILMKALEKDPDRRYQTAAEFSDDITRFLEGEPVVAKNPSLFYITRKKIYRRRSWIAFGLATAALAWFLVWGLTRTVEDDLKDRRVLLDINHEFLRNGLSDITYRKAMQAAAEYPDLPEAVLVRTHAYVLNRETNVAIAILKREIEQDPAQWSYQLLLSELDSRATPPGLAEQNGRGLFDEKTASADAWYLRSFTTFDVQRIFEYTKQALAVDPNHVLSLESMSHLTALTNEPDVALAATRYMIAGKLEISRWNNHLITLLAKLGRVEEALEECETMLADRPDLSTGHYIKAKLNRRLGNYAEAVRDYSSVIELRERVGPKDPWPYYHRGTVLWLLGNRKAAVDDYQEAYRILGFVTFANARMYIFLRYLGREDEAAEVLQEARRSEDLDPWLRHIFECLGGELSPGRLAAEAERVNDPLRLCEAYYYAGEAALLSGPADTATEWFEKCVDTGVEYDPNNILESASEFELARWRLDETSNQPQTPER